MIQRFTALGCTPNTWAASTCDIPSSTAWTARLRSAAWAAPGRDRASSFDMWQAYEHLTLFGYRGGNSAGAEGVEGLADGLSWRLAQQLQNLSVTSACWRSSQARARSAAS